MTKDKYAFILDLIESKKLNPSQKEQVLRLSALEMKKEGGKIDERLNTIEGRLNKLGDNLKVNKKYDRRKHSDKSKNEVSLDILKDSGTTYGKVNVQNDSENHLILHTPNKTVELLKYFTSNDKNLKYSTHSWEYGKFSGYDNFMESIQKEWKEISEDLKKQKNRLHAKISNFLFNEKLGVKDGKYYNSWGDKKLKFGWASPELKEFMISGAMKDPFNCPIPERIKSIEKESNLFYFKDYVAVFKNEIEIREDSNALKKIINSLWEEELSYDFHVKSDNVEGISFYTDVALFKESLKLIFRSFKSRPEFPNIRIKAEKKENSVLIRLTQIESKCRRNIDDPKIISPNGGDLDTIIKSLNGLADFSISATFQDNINYRVNFLASDTMVNHIETIENIDGFTYELKFYL